MPPTLTRPSASPLASPLAAITTGAAAVPAMEPEIAMSEIRPSDRMVVPAGSEPRTATFPTFPCAISLEKLPTTSMVEMPPAPVAMSPTSTAPLPRPPGALRTVIDSAVPENSGCVRSIDSTVRLPAAAPSGGATK